MVTGQGDRATVLVVTTVARANCAGSKHISTRASYFDSRKSLIVLLRQLLIAFDCGLMPLSLCFPFLVWTMKSNKSNNVVALSQVFLLSSKSKYFCSLAKILAGHSGWAVTERLSKLQERYVMKFRSQTKKLAFFFTRQLLQPGLAVWTEWKEPSFSR